MWMNCRSSWCGKEGYEEAHDSWVPWRDCRELELLLAYLQSVPELNKFKKFFPKVEDGAAGGCSECSRGVGKPALRLFYWV